MASQGTIEKIRGFILKELIKDPSIRLDDDAPIITSGLITSFSIMEIALFIESEFGLFIPDGDLTVKNMDTLQKIASMVEDRI